MQVQEAQAQVKKKPGFAKGYKYTQPKADVSPLWQSILLPETVEELLEDAQEIIRTGKHKIG
jgi:hypothetical protein